MAMRGPEVIVIGAGQAGLSTSYFLSGHGLDHVVLDRGTLASSWVERRWESFTLVTPNWTVRLPGAEYRDADPNGFMRRGDIAAYMGRWAKSFDCPVRTGTEATGLGPGRDGRFRVDTSDGPLEASAVVVATGSLQTPRRPRLADFLSPRIQQLDAETYKNPEDLDPGPSWWSVPARREDRSPMNCGSRAEGCC
ncbi:MAG: NAD(P)-binding domain-containing protein [Gemmatimonadetes bacterium]|nr:NAD(P)-binding domain-containing protein [Gemmatimonadota bacterium]